MDAIRFDAVARMVGASADRRRALRAILGGAAGLLGIADTVSATSGRCTPACGECKVCAFLPCRKRRGKKCKGGHCVNRFNGTGCEGGECRDGACNAEPICASFNFFCTKPSECCSNACDLTLLECLKGESGAQCRADSDCASGSCLGFRCD